VKIECVFLSLRSTLIKWKQHERNGITNLGTCLICNRMESPGEWPKRCNHRTQGVRKEPNTKIIEILTLKPSTKNIMCYNRIWRERNKNRSVK